MTVTFKQLTYDQIHPSENNLRLEFDQEGLDRLEDSIVGMGILQALLVRKNEDGYEIVAGERRWRAVGQAIQKGRVPADFPIPSTIKTGIDNPQQTAAMVVENLHRAGLTPTEEYRGLLRLANEYSWTVDQIADATGIPKAIVKARLSWAKLPADRIDELVATAGVTNVTELASLPADTQAKVLKAKGDKVVTTMRTAIEAKGRDDRARKLMAGLRRKGHLVISELADLTDPKFATEKALFDKLTRKAKKDGGEVRTKHLWHVEIGEIDDKYDVPTLFTVKADQWNVNVEYFHIFMPFVRAEDKPVDPATQTDLQRAQAERRAEHDQAIEDWNAKLVEAKHELLRNGKASELIAMVLRDAIEEIEDELACEYDLTDEGDVTVLEFAGRNATSLARAAAAFVLTNRWTLPPGFPDKPEYSAVNRLHYDGDGNFIPEDQRVIESPAPEPDEEHGESDGEPDEGNADGEPYPELSDSEEAAEEATWD